jgi:hypothetical protein
MSIRPLHDARRDPSRPRRERRRLSLESLEDRMLLDGKPPLGPALLAQIFPISAQGATVTGVAGTPITGTIATFTSANPVATVGNFTATIDWGDTTSSTGTITQPGGVGTQFVVTATHNYALALTYPVTVKIDDVGGASATANSTAVVADAPLTVTSFTIPAPVFEGSSYGGQVATLVTGNTLATPASFVASIDWGDGTTSAGVITPTGTPGTFTIAPDAAHTFGLAATYTVTVQVISLGGSRGSTSQDVQVLDAPIVQVPTAPLTGVAGNPVSGVVVAFTQFPLTPPSDFTASINWGDGVISPGTVAAGTDGQFTVSGTHTFVTNNTFTINVKISDTAGTMATLPQTAIIADAPLTSKAAVVAAVAGVPFTSTVATFTSTNTFSQASEFSATINWGDGSAPSAGTIVGSGGSFAVVGTHIYATTSAGFPFTVSIQHNGPGPDNSTTSASGSARVILPLAGAMSRSSDSGVSNVDGITNINDPLFLGTAQPGATINLFATEFGVGTPILVGTTVADSAGNWSTTTNTLADGVYVVTGTMTDPVTNLVVQTTVLPITPTGGVLQIDTVQPTVAALSFSPSPGTLGVLLQDVGSGLYLPAISNAGNYSLALAVGLGFQPFPSTGLTVTPVSTNEDLVTIGFNLGSKAKPGVYVVTIQSRGIIDIAGNILNPGKFVTFPQFGPSPNPNFVAQFVVAPNGTVTGPTPFVSLAEQNAANSYFNLTQKRLVTQTPKSFGGHALPPGGPVRTSLVLLPNPTWKQITSHSKRK